MLIQSYSGCGTELKPGSQYDNGAASVASNVSIMKKAFYKSSSNPDVKFPDNLIVWTLANAGGTMLE